MDMFQAQKGALPIIEGFTTSRRQENQGNQKRGDDPMQSASLPWEKVNVEIDETSSFIPSSPVSESVYSI